MEQVFLTRRNLLILLSKLNRRRKGEATLCSIIKNDNSHPKYPQTMKSIQITALEDEEYYTDRKPGVMNSIDEKRIEKMYKKR
jgi:hypothetical protein